MIRLAQSIISKSFNLTLKNSFSQYTNNATVKSFSAFTPLVKYNFGIMDYATKQGRDKKLADKQSEQVRKQIELLANKPTYTILDYKQRVLDQLNQIRKKALGLAKFLGQNNDQQKQLQVQKKIFLAMFDSQLKNEEGPNGQLKIAISLASQVPIENVNKTFKKYQIQRKMHKMLRNMKEQGQQLPKDFPQLEYMFMRSGLQSSGGRKEKYAKYQKRSTPAMNRYIKWGKTR